MRAGSVAGDTIKPARRSGASSPASAEKNARSDQRSRGRGELRRSTATSCPESAARRRARAPRGDGRIGVAPRSARDRRIEVPSRHPADPHQPVLQSRTREMEPLTTHVAPRSGSARHFPQPVIVGTAAHGPTAWLAAIHFNGRVPRRWSRRAPSRRVATKSRVAPSIARSRRESRRWRIVLPDGHPSPVLRSWPFS
jgi:hypothetical protein